MAFWRFMADWGIWDITGLLLLMVPIIFVLCYLFPRKAIKNFYIDTRRGSINAGYPKVVRLILRNLTNEPIYVLSEGFKFKSTISASPNAAKNAATNVCEVKFEGRQHYSLTEIDTLVRPSQEVCTWVPVDPSHSDEEIDAAIQTRNVGVLRLRCKRLSGRRDAAIRMRIPV